MMSSKYSRVCAEIDMDAIAENFRIMHEAIHPETKMVAVIKTDGYGHGAVPIAQMIQPEDYIWGFAVATMTEAMILRKNQITKPVLILGYTFEEDYEDLIRYEIRPIVFKLDMAKELSEAAVHLKKTLSIHIGLDTGMSRIGFSDTEESIETIRKIASLPGIEIEGMFTHFAKEQHVICVLKDAGTVVSNGSESYINTSGNSGMATAGSGDVLTGVFAGLTAQGMTLFEAAKLAVFLHGCAGDAAAQKYGKRSMTANDLVEGLIRVLADADDKNKCK